MNYKEFKFKKKYLKECGGGGNCYFLSVAESLIQLKNYAEQYDDVVKRQMNHYLESLKTYVGGNSRKNLSDKLRKDVVGKLLEKYSMGDKTFLNPVDRAQEQQFYRYLPDDFVNADNNNVNIMDAENLETNPELKLEIENYFNDYFERMASPGTWATSLEVMGTILLLRDDYNIMVGVTAAGTAENDPDSGVRNANGSAIIRIYNTTGYGSNGMHYQMLPFTSYNGRIICTDGSNEYPNCSNTASSGSNAGNTRNSPQVDDTTKDLMNKLIPEYIEFIKEYIEKIKKQTIDDAEKKRLTSDIELHLSYLLHVLTGNYVMISTEMEDKINNIINSYFDNEEGRITELKEKSKNYSEGSKIKLEFIQKLNESNKSIKTKKPEQPKKKKGNAYCCKNLSKGGGLKIKILKKSNKTKKISRKWSKKYKNSINCSEPRGFSQRQFCLSKTKKIREKNKKKNKSSKK